MIDKRKNKVQEPEFGEDKDYFYATDDIDTMYEVGGGGFITVQEHNPVVNVKKMFDHLRNKKMYRYENEGDSPLNDFPYNFGAKMNYLKSVVENDYYLNSKYDDPNFKPTENDLESRDYMLYRESYEESQLGANTPTEIWNADYARHYKMHMYTRELATEYAIDFENKVQHGDFDPEEVDVIAEQYKKALADKIGKFVGNYDPDDPEEYGEYFNENIRNYWD